jgi:uncharacterized membrane protein
MAKPWSNIMILHHFEVLAWLLVVCSSLMAGIYLTFSVVIMRSLAQLPIEAGIGAMNAINRHIVRTAFMPLFFGSTVIALLMLLVGFWFFEAPGAYRAILTGGLYVIGMFLVTALGNVPLNNQLDKLSGHEPNAETVWQHYLSRWTRLNSLRALACLATFAGCLSML